MSRVCVVGLGKLGACMAAVFADAGHDVVGVDVNEQTVTTMRLRVAPVDEPGLQKLIDENRARLTAVSNLELAVAASDIAFIIVPTLSKPDGFFDHSIVLQTAIEIGEAIRFGDGIGHEINPDSVERPFTVVVSSTVMPGTCRNAIQPAIDAAAGRHIPVCYSPEFIALGSVIDDMRHPDMVLVGADDNAVSAFVEVLQPVVDPDVEWHFLSLLDAELAKIAVNSFVTMKISFANQLARICEGLPGADARIILNAIGGDTRIGRRYLNPGGPYGGPCFPRDNRAFQAMATRASADAPLAVAADKINDNVVKRIIATVPTWGTVAILGMTYKTDTSVRTESLGVRLLEHFQYAEVHDPTVPDTGQAQHRINGVDYVIVATPWPEYSTLDYSKNDVVIDVWGVLPKAPNVVRLGVGR